MNVVKPSITSVDFRRHGREVSVTVNGDNLWFCYHIQVAHYKTKVCAKDTSQHSLQFNYDAENDTRIAMDADHVKVVLSCHFSNPVKDIHVQVSRKVCFSLLVLFHSVKEFFLTSTMSTVQYVESCLFMHVILFIMPRGVATQAIR